MMRMLVKDQYFNILKWSILSTRQIQTQPIVTGLLANSSQQCDLTFTTLKRFIPFLVKRTQLNSTILDFTRTEDGSVVVYTDGSCLNNNIQIKNLVGQRKSGIGVYWGSPDHPLNVSLPHGGTRLTNNRAEIAAAHSAIILAKALGIERLRLYTDSQNLVKACKFWLPYWQHNGWKLKGSDKTVKNRDMWQRLTDDMIYVLVDFVHAKDNVDGIKEAHKLANIGANATPTIEDD